MLLDRSAVPAAAAARCTRRRSPLLATPLCPPGTFSCPVLGSSSAAFAPPAWPGGEWHDCSLGLHPARAPYHRRRRRHEPRPCRLQVCLRPLHSTARASVRGEQHGVSPRAAGHHLSQLDHGRHLPQVPRPRQLGHRLAELGQDRHAHVQRRAKAPGARLTSAIPPRCHIEQA